MGRGVRISRLGPRCDCFFCVSKVADESKISVVACLMTSVVSTLDWKMEIEILTSRKLLTVVSNKFVIRCCFFYCLK